MAGEKHFDLLALIADDQSIISSRPRWNVFTGSINATILLQQVIYRWVQNGRRPFYKFTRPCKQKAYRVGDSWCEELGMSRREFDSARNKIAAKTRGNVDQATLVSYWVTADRKTWYALNEGQVVAKLHGVYPQPESAAGIQGELLMADSATSPLAESATSPLAHSATSPMADSATSPLAHSAIRYSKDNNKDNNRDNTETTAVSNGDNEPVDNSVAATAADGAYAMLLGVGVLGKPLAKLSKKRPSLVLAWVWAMELEGMERKYRPGFIVNQLRANTAAPPALNDLATNWLKLDSSDREILRGLVDGMSPVAERPFSDHVPDGYFRHLYEDSLNAFATLYKAGAYLTEW